MVSDRRWSNIDSECPIQREVSGWIPVLFSQWSLSESVRSVLFSERSQGDAEA